ncbi:MAG: SDR family NAD(P)-dependent oxidoreductase, partial [Pseudomonadota bacterium]|nr:SDR family NAD(P)-dependent oxidoreductase [Pseudomonadota bacterium]
RVLASAGAEVTLAVRNVEAGQKVAADIASTTGNDKVHVLPLDLADRRSIDTLIAAWQGPLHILVNNAGVMASPEARTPEGWESQFATNHLGHFALALGLHPAMKKEGARVVALSSSGHHLSPVVFEDIHFDIRPYEAWAAYGQAKSANALFAIEAARRWAADGITANAVMPGAIKTNLQRHTGELVSPEEYWKTPPQGAATSVLVAASPLLDGVTGRYFADCNQALPITRSNGNRFDEMSLVAHWAIDPQLAQRLWNVSLAMLGKA